MNYLGSNINPNNFDVSIKALFPLLVFTNAKKPPAEQFFEQKSTSALPTISYPSLRPSDFSVW
jgi:hypothetical protein